jgi:glycerol-3-phosphate acyltransferase PlsY
MRGVVMENYVLPAGVGYLLGSLNFGVILSKIGYPDDVRRHGSGNAGATNMTRSFGWGAGALTLACDMGKALGSMAIGKKLAGHIGMAVSGIACVVGHCWPVYYNFKGGKGVAVGAGVALMISPAVFFSVLATFVAGAFSTKKVSVGSVCAAAALPAASFAFKVSKPKKILACCAAAVVLWEHRPNIKRLIQNTEPDFHAGSHCRFGMKAE